MTLTSKRNKGAGKHFRLKEIAELVQGEVVGNPETLITGVSGIREAGDGDIAYLASSKNLSLLAETQASAVIVPKEAALASSKSLIVSENPTVAFTRVVEQFVSSERPLFSGVHPSAVVDPGVRLGRGVTIGPHGVLESGVEVGEGTRIGAHAFIGQDCVIGRNVRIYANVSVQNASIGDRTVIYSGAVIGGEGFGYNAMDGENFRIPHIGTVVIEEDVEIGACVCVDRAKFKETIVRKGTKIGNLVQIAHNVVIGENCVIISQTGISGSAELGKNVILAGGVGIVDHVKLGDRVIVGAGAGVTKSFPADTILLGGPARPIHEQKKIFAAISRLPELFREFAALKKKVEKTSS